MKEKNLIAILLGISLFIQLGYMLVYESPINLEYGSDSEQYIHLAKNLYTKGYVLDRRGDVLVHNIPYDKSMEQSTAWRVPGYPLFLAFSFMFYDSYTFIYMIQICLSLAAFAMLYKICKYFFGNTAALIFLIILILTPVYVAYSTQIMSDTLGIFLLVSIVYLFLFKRNIPLIAALSGFSLLVRSQYLFLVPILCLFLLYKKQYKKLAFFVIIFLAVLSPWIIRNYIVFDAFIPLSAQSGEALYFNTLPYQPELGDQGGCDEYLLPYHFSLVNSDLSEAEVSKILTKEAFKRMREDPIGIFKNKVVNFFITISRPYRIQAFDSDQYDNYISKVTFFGNFLKRGTIGHFLFKYSYWGFWIFVWLSGIIFMMFNFKKYLLINMLALYPLLLGFTSAFAERALIPFYPFMLMLACALWLKNENWNFRGRINWINNSQPS